MHSLIHWLFRPLHADTPDKLLLAVLSVDFMPTQLRTTGDALLKMPVDWAELLRQSKMHRVSGLVYLRLRDCFAQQVPPSVLALFEAEYRAQQWDTLDMTAQMTKIVQRLAAVGIEALPLKGPAIALHLYETPFARDYKDIDLLVRRDQLDRAAAALEGMGYDRAVWLEDSPGTLLNEFHMSQHQTYIRTYADRPNITQIELHWAVATSFGSFADDEARLWSRVEPVNYGGFRFLALPPDDLLIILLMHGAKHMWSSLHWLVDLAAFVQRYPAFDWDAFLDTAHARQIKRLAGVAFATAERLLGLALPSALRAAADQDPYVAIMAAHTADLLFDSRRLDTSGGQFRFVLFQLLLRPTWGLRAAYLVYTLRHRRSPATRLLLLQVVAAAVVVGVVAYVGWRLLSG